MFAESHLRWLPENGELSAIRVCVSGSHVGPTDCGRPAGSQLYGLRVQY